MEAINLLNVIKKEETMLEEIDVKTLLSENIHSVKLEHIVINCFHIFLLFRFIQNHMVFTLF